MFDNLNDYNNMLQAQQAARFRAGHGPQPAGLAAYKAKQAAAELRELAPYSVKKDDIYSASPWHVYNDGKALCEFFATKKAAVAWIHEQKNRRETISTDAAPAASVPETDATPEQPAAVVETPAADPAPETDAPAVDVNEQPAASVLAQRVPVNKPPRSVAPEKPFAGEKICGQGWTIVFDIALQRTRVIVNETIREKAAPIVENAGFYYSKQTDSWHKKLTFKAQRAAVALADNLRRAIA